MKLHTVYAAINGCAGLVALAFGIGVRVQGAIGDRTFAAIVLCAALLLLISAAAFAMRSRWLVLLACLPLVAGSACYALMLLAGGWIWAGGQSGPLYLGLAACLLILCYLVSGIASLWWRKSSRN
jgi:ligand-binding sensor domain-containing protein